MRRLVVPFVIGVILCLTTGSAYAQFSTTDTLGFGTHTRDTLKQVAGDTIELPVYLYTDSMVTGLSMLFYFDTAYLYPVIAKDYGYQHMVDSLTALGLEELITDSTEYQASPIMDSGLWNVDMRVSNLADDTWNPTWGTAQVLYNLNLRGHARLLMTPIPPGFEGDPNYDKPYLPGQLGGAPSKGAVIAYLKFTVNPEADSGTYSRLKLELQNADLQKTEMAQEWFTEGVDTIPHTQAVIPRFDSTWFKVDVDTGGGPGPSEEFNDLPILNLGTSQTVYDINPGQQVSFTVSASDAEGGVLRIYANNGSLPPNANFGSNGLVTGAGGVATGTFSFVPDISQQGTFSFSFKAVDDSSASSAIKAVVVNVAKPDVDVLFTTSADGLSPAGGVPGLKDVIVPINVVTKNVIYGIQFDMDYNANYFDLDSVFNSDRAAEWVIYDNIGVDPGYLRVVAFGLSNDSMVAGSSSAVLYLAFSVDEFAEFGPYPLTIYDAWESIDPNPGMSSLQLETDNGVLYVDRWGDVNLDQRIDVADLVSTVAYIINTYPLNRRQFAAADIIINGAVNVVDLVGIINTIFGLPISQSPAPILEGDEYATLKVLHDEITEAGVEADMAVTAEMPTSVAGVELEIQYNPQTIEMLKPTLAPGADGFQISSNDNGSGLMKVVIYSNRPWNESELIQRGLSDIVKLPFISRGPIAAGDNRAVRITKAFVSTGAAKNIPVEGVNGPVLPNAFELYQNRPNPFNPTTTIDFYIDGSGQSGTERVTLEVFNILGQLVNTLVDKDLPAGDYSVVWDGSDENGARTASGVYLYRLKVGDASETKKMMLLK